jgi:hypothetical protein
MTASPLPVRAHGVAGFAVAAPRAAFPMES